MDVDREGASFEARHEEKGIDTHIPPAAYRYCRRYRYLFGRESVTTVSRTALPLHALQRRFFCLPKESRRSVSLMPRIFISPRISLLIIYPFFDEEGKEFPRIG